MIIDVHTHLGCDAGFYQRRWWPYACTADDLLTRMDACGVDQAICFPFTLPSAFDVDAFAKRGEVNLLPGRTPFDRENDLLIWETERLGRGRLLPFAMFDPAREIANQVRALEQLAGQIRGLKTQTTVLKSPISLLRSESRVLMDFAAANGLPVIVHTSYSPADTWAQVHDCLDVAETFPSVRFNLAHSLRFDRTGLARAAQLPNVWIDCSAHVIHCRLAAEDAPAIAPRGESRVDADYSRPEEVLAAIRNIIPGKYMWGSDCPYMSWRDDSLGLLSRYEEEVSVLDKLPSKLRDELASGAATEWLGAKLS